jgi:di/tricarboxylate transporter
MLVPFHGEARLRRKAWLAVGIMAITVIAASLGPWPLDLVILGGAAAVVLTGCLSARQAYRSIDPHVHVFIAGAIPLGLAMETSGTSSLIAGWLQSILSGWSQTAILFVCFAVVGVLTQFLSDAATTAVFAPVAAALARGLGHRPEPYVVTVAMAAIISFLTPLGHHGNLLVYGPGGYRFLDFVRVGTPLTAVAAVVVVFLSQILWPG